jgi:uncharacterized radical SAM superfamily Fe-S cluster-containing enzyme
LMESLRTTNEKFDSGRNIRAKAAAVTSVMKNVKLGSFRKYLLSVLSTGSYTSLSDLHHNMLMIGSMHFMDPYNFDIERVQRCVVHYATPDGKIIPFCTMNTLHRATAEKRLARPLDARFNTPLYDIESLIKKIENDKW